MASLKIRKLYLRDVNQFRDVVLDFTDPKTGKAADRICLIGRNGTGKSTVLKLLDGVLGNRTCFWPIGTDWRFVAEVENNDVATLFGAWRFMVDGASFYRLFNIFDDSPLWVNRFLSISAMEDCEILARDCRARGVVFDSVHAGKDEPWAADLVIFSPAETGLNQGPGLTGVPSTNLNAALALSKSAWPIRHEVANDQITNMWLVLIHLIKKREADRNDFELRPENLEKTKSQLLREFDTISPPVLEGLAALWNRILDRAGLELDVEHAKVPFQLTDNLEAYIRHKATGRNISYHELSTGMRNFLFRIGHLYLLFFNRKVERGFVLIDEPENSLFPDFLFDLMQTYEDILRDKDGVTHTQLFVATHNPIVAAQFEPHERVLLEWDDDGGVIASKGTAPKGDDPNDLLRKDFHLLELMGEVGQQRYREYQELRKRIRRAPEAEKAELIDRAAAIARDYGFTE